MPRLSRATLDTLPADVRRPGPPPPVRIVHLGLGAFHRGHQAIYTEDAGGGWGICGVTQRSRAVLDQLAPQDGLYTLLERGAGAAPPRVVGVVREVLSASDDWPALRARLADPAVRVVTVTVTEKAYRPLEPNAGASITVVEQLVGGLRARFAAGAGPLTVLSCDNLPGNGGLLRRLVVEQAGLLDPALAGRIGAEVRFPATVVDRIVPATTDADRAEVVERLAGLTDAGAVVAEPYSLWVIEDDFAGPRPAWETAGARLADAATVRAYELLKLRMLNGSHSALAYLGLLSDRATIADAVADPLLREAVDALLRDEVAPTLRPPAGVDLDAYRTELLGRYANPALRHTTVQVGTDGSQKLPQRLLPPAAERLAAGLPIEKIALALAAWFLVLWRRRSDSGRPIPVHDPLAETIAARLADVRTPAEVVGAMLGLDAVFDRGLAADPRFGAAVTTQLDGLAQDGVRATLTRTHPS